MFKIVDTASDIMWFELGRNGVWYPHDGTYRWETYYESHEDALAFCQTSQQISRKQLPNIRIVPFD